MRRLWIVVIGVACAAVAAIVVIGLANQDDAGRTRPPQPTGSLAQPAFTPFDAPDVEGEIVVGEGAGGRLALRDLRGRPVVVNFWASWCAPCRDEAPDLVAFARANPDVALLGVNVQDGRGAASGFAEELGFDWPTVADRDGSTARAFRLLGLPGTFVIDASGRVVYRKLGTVTAEELAAAVAAPADRSGE